MYSHITNESQKREELTKNKTLKSSSTPVLCRIWRQSGAQLSSSGVFPILKKTKKQKHPLLRSAHSSTGHKVRLGPQSRLVQNGTVATCLIPDFSVSSCGSRCLNTNAAGLGAAVPASVSGIEMRQLCVFHHPVQKKREFGRTRGRTKL